MFREIFICDMLLIFINYVVLLLQMCAMTSSTVQKVNLHLSDNGTKILYMGSKFIDSLGYIAFITNLVLQKIEFSDFSGR